MRILESFVILYHYLKLFFPGSTSLFKINRGSESGVKHQKMELIGKRKTSRNSAAIKCPHVNFADLCGLNQMMSLTARYLWNSEAIPCKSIKLKTKNNATTKKSEKQTRISHSILILKKNDPTDPDKKIWRIIHFSVKNVH